VSDSNVIKLAQPGAFTGSLIEILRSGARAPLTQANPKPQRSRPEARCSEGTVYGRRALTDEPGACSRCRNHVRKAGACRPADAFSLRR
jgi:hypothetical protein